MGPTSPSVWDVAVSCTPCVPPPPFHCPPPPPTHVTHYLKNKIYISLVKQLKVGRYIYQFKSLDKPVCLSVFLRKKTQKLQPRSQYTCTSMHDKINLVFAITNRAKQALGHCVRLATVPREVFCRLLLLFTMNVVPDDEDTANNGQAQQL